jgi:methionine synthase II (cobalamin-independent)
MNQNAGGSFQIKQKSSQRWDFKHRTIIKMIRKVPSRHCPSFHFSSLHFLFFILFVFDMSSRFQIVGSFMRPQDLLTYKRQIEQRDDITYPLYDAFDGYQAAESEAIRNLVAKQIQHGLTIRTDGEFSRSLWHLDFAWGVKGIRRFIDDHGYFFRDKDETSAYETRRDLGLRITGELSGKNHHFIKLFQRLQTLASGFQTKLCVPSATQIFRGL